MQPDMAERLAEALRQAQLFEAYCRVPAKAGKKTVTFPADYFWDRHRKLRASLAAYRASKEGK